MIISELVFNKIVSLDDVSVYNEDGTKVNMFDSNPNTTWSTSLVHQYVGVKFSCQDMNVTSLYIQKNTGLMSVYWRLSGGRKGMKTLEASSTNGTVQFT
jgi:hypothetical protein